MDFTSVGTQSQAKSAVSLKPLLTPPDPSTDLFSDTI